MVKIEPAKLREDVDFSEIADVVIVGFGGAGASAAISAAEGGKKIVIVERTTGGGGSTALSGGIVYLGGGTPPQLANGYADSAENMARYLKALQPRAKVEKVDAYCQGSVGHYQWLQSLGLPFNDRYHKEKHFTPLSDETLLDVGSEDCYPYSEIATPAPRGHKPGGGYVGNVIFDHLRRRVEELGVQVINDALVTALVRDGAGAIVGVQYRKEGRNFAIGARKGVVLATGGAEWNHELARAHHSKIARKGVTPLGVATADGSGIFLGESVGAATVNLEQAVIDSPFYPPESLIKGILVNALGKRFVAEDLYHGASSHAVLDQPEGKAYLICDVRNFARPVLGDIHGDIKHKVIDAWESIPHMERDLDMPEGALVKTIEDYNRYAAAGHDEEFRKNPKWLDVIEDVPFGAINCSIGSAYYCALSLGGLDTDDNGRVLRSDGSAVMGLYATGQLAPSLAIDGVGYNSGLLIGSSTFFGRRTGSAVARAADLTESYWSDRTQHGQRFDRDFAGRP